VKRPGCQFNPAVREGRSFILLLERGDRYASFKQSTEERLGCLILLLERRDRIAGFIDRRDRDASFIERRHWYAGFIEKRDWDASFILP